MKIDCDKCGAKYSIADEKVRGKTFKIRCKKCSNVIIVRDKAAAASGGAAESDAGMAVAHAGWHLAINGETVGPLSEDEVRQRYAAREIDKDTAIWQEGFEDWMPLGDVMAFADLPEQPAATGHDPFGAALEDNYGAAGPAAAVGMGAASGFDAGFGASAPASSRVSKLSGQRNENSVLFSLDSLQALATGGPSASPGAAAGPSAHSSGRTLATQAPASEGSGLIDIRALGAMVQGDKRESQSGAGGPMPQRSDEPALPSFGGAGLGGLGASPLITPSVEPAAAAVAAPPAPRSTTPLYIMMGLLIVAVGALAYTFFIFATRPEPDPRVVERIVPGEVASVNAASDEEDEDEKDEEDEGDAKRAKKDDDADDKSRAERSANAKQRSADRRSRRARNSGGSSSNKNDKPAAPAPSNSASASNSDNKGSSGSSDSLDVDCILNPSLAKCKGGSKGSSKSAPAAAAPDPNLPMQLTQSQIKAGVAPHKSAAKTCGSKYGAKTGEKVQVKLSISGSSGSVVSASAQGSHSGTPLGKCVEAALQKAKFSKFQKDQMGVLYPIVM